MVPRIGIEDKDDLERPWKDDDCDRYIKSHVVQGASPPNIHSGHEEFFSLAAVNITEIETVDLRGEAWPAKIHQRLG